MGPSSPDPGQLPVPSIFHLDPGSPLVVFLLQSLHLAPVTNQGQARKDRLEPHLRGTSPPSFNANRHPHTGSSIWAGPGMQREAQFPTWTPICLPHPYVDEVSGGSLSGPSWGHASLCSCVSVLELKEGKNKTKNIWVPKIPSHIQPTQQEDSRGTSLVVQGEDSELPVHRAQIPSLVRGLDLTAATKTQHSQISNFFF